MDCGDCIAIGEFVERDFGCGLDGVGNHARLTEYQRKRHGEAAGMRCAQQLLRIGARAAFKASGEPIGRVLQYAGLGDMSQIFRFQSARFRSSEMSLFKRNKYVLTTPADRSNTQIDPTEITAEIRALLSQLDRVSLRRGNNGLKLLPTRREQHFHDVKNLLEGAHSTVRTGLRTALEVGGTQVRMRPWQTLGLVLGTALLLGALVARR